MRFAKSLVRPPHEAEQAAKNDREDKEGGKAPTSNKRAKPTEEKQASGVPHAEQEEMMPERGSSTLWQAFASLKEWAACLSRSSQAPLP